MLYYESRVVIYECKMFYRIDHWDTIIRKDLPVLRERERKQSKCRNRVILEGLFTRVSFFETICTSFSNANCVCFYNELDFHINARRRNAREL